MLLAAAAVLHTTPCLILVDLVVAVVSIMVSQALVQVLSLQILHKETLAVLEKLLSGLNERERIVIRLLDLEQRPVREVAELTGWGESKVKVTAMRARRRLGERLAAMERKAAP